jgi:hypothetical protein
MPAGVEEGMEKTVDNVVCWPLEIDDNRATKKTDKASISLWILGSPFMLEPH